MPTGQLVSRANSDAALVQGLLNFLPLMTGNVLMLVLSLVVMFVLAPGLALLALVVVPALFAVSYRMRRRVLPATWDGQQREGDVAQIVDEGVNGVRVVKAFGQEERELHRLAAAAQRLYGSRLRATRIQARYQPVLEAIPKLAQVAVLVLGGLLALHGSITIGTFLAFSTYVAQFAAPARQLAGLLTVGQQAQAGISRIFGLLDLEPRIVDAPGATRPAPTLRGEITLRGRPLRVRPGPPGAGRGEPAHRAPASGSPSWARAAAASRCSPRSSRVSTTPTPAACSSTATTSATSRSPRCDGHIGFAFEESFLFSDSIRANIAYGRPDASEDDIVAAARVARADEFVRELAGRLRHGGRRARADALGRAAAAHRARPGRAHRSAHPRPRRRDERRRREHRGRRSTTRCARCSPAGRRC